MLTSDRNAGKSDAIPILLSDVEFEAFLILTERLGPVGIRQTPSAEDWRLAKERALIIRLLADQARRLHETATEEDKRALRQTIVENMGDEKGVNRLLARIGVPKQALDRWIENAALAVGQIRQINEQIALPARNVGQRNGRASSKEHTAAAQLRRPDGSDAKNKALRARLMDIVAESRIQVLR